MRYYIQVRDSYANENKLTRAVAETLRRNYDGYVMDGRHFRALVEAVRLTVAELNAKYKRCTPIDRIDDSSYGGQVAIWVGGHSNFSLTLYMQPVNGDLIL